MGIKYVCPICPCIMVIEMTLIKKKPIYLHQPPKATTFERNKGERYQILIRNSNSYSDCDRWNTGKVQLDSAWIMLNWVCLDVLTSSFRKTDGSEMPHSSKLQRNGIFTVMSFFFFHHQRLLFPGCFMLPTVMVNFCNLIGLRNAGIHFFLDMSVIVLLKEICIWICTLNKDCLYNVGGHHQIHWGSETNKKVEEEQICSA